MKNNNNRILIISSKPPGHSAGLGQSHIDALEQVGFQVDFLTRYYSKGLASNVSYIEKEKLSYKKIILDSKELAKRLGIYKILRNIKIRLNKSRKVKIENDKSNGIYGYFYYDETHPDVPIEKILDKINKDYVAVVTIFWQEMVNTTTLRAIYEKLHCPIFISSPDMAPMTGGCYYFGACENFKNGCGECPALVSTSKIDQSSKNYVIKKENYEKTCSIFCGNTWMCRFAEESKLFKNIERSGIIINHNVFRPSNKSIEFRNKVKISQDDFVILLRSSSLVRKGNPDIAKAISKFLSLVPDKKRDVTIMIVGDTYFETHLKDVKCNIIDFGSVEINKLVECYQMADVFINASYDDAGPSMINQSLMCGTPVVCYNNGVALDVVIDGESGYKTTTGDMDGLAQCLVKVYSLSPEDYRRLRETSRQIALEHNSEEAFGHNMKRLIEKYRKII